MIQILPTIALCALASGTQEVVHEFSEFVGLSVNVPISQDVPQFPSSLGTLLSVEMEVGVTAYTPAYYPYTQGPGLATRLQNLHDTGFPAWMWVGAQNCPPQGESPGDLPGFWQKVTIRNAFGSALVGATQNTGVIYLELDDSGPGTEEVWKVTTKPEATGSTEWDELLNRWIGNGTMGLRWHTTYGGNNVCASGNAGTLVGHRALVRYRVVYTYQP